MSAKAMAWIEARTTEDLAISEWTITEILAALSVKLRTGAITQEERSAALAETRRMTEESFIVLPVTSEDFRIAARLADLHMTGLRGGDALHLAVASVAGAALWTLDRGQAEAGMQLGIVTHILP